MMWLLGFYWLTAGHATFLYAVPGYRDAHWLDKFGAYLLSIAWGGIFVPAKLMEKAIS